MKKSHLIAIVGVALAAGFCGGLLTSGLNLPSVHAQGKNQTPKEPVATADEFASHVIHEPELPSVELVKGATSKLIAGEQSMLSFLKMDKNSYFAPHRHKQEQIMTVLEGYCDEIIEGKLYRVKKGDVIILPPNIEHGAYMYDQDVQVLDVFGDVRSDYMIKMVQAMAAMNKKK